MRARDTQPNQQLMGRQILWIVADSIRSHVGNNAQLTCMRELDSYAFTGKLATFVNEWTTMVSQANMRCTENPIDDDTYRDILLGKVRDVNFLSTDVEDFLRKEGTPDFCHNILLQYLERRVKRDRTLRTRAFAPATQNRGTGLPV